MKEKKKNPSFFFKVTSQRFHCIHTEGLVSLIYKMSHCYANKKVHFAQILIHSGVSNHFEKGWKEIEIE